jgi:hypothetical protein
MSKAARTKITVVNFLSYTASVADWRVHFRPEAEEVRITPIQAFEGGTGGNWGCRVIGAAALDGE